MLDPIEPVFCGVPFKIGHSVTRVAPPRMDRLPYFHMALKSAFSSGDQFATMFFALCAGQLHLALSARSLFNALHSSLHTCHHHDRFAARPCSPPRLLC